MLILLTHSTHKLHNEGSFVQPRILIVNVACPTLTVVTLSSEKVMAAPTALSKS